jgi:quercetin dioxygenase-like cupin family protein
MSIPKLSACCGIALLAAVTPHLAAQNRPPLIDNEQVRVLKVTDQPHTKTPPHEHKLNRVMVYLDAGRQEITESGGRKSTMEWKAGEVRWSPAAGSHVAEIVSNAPVSIIEVEIKKQGDPNKTATSALDPVKVDPKEYGWCG